MEQPRVGVIIVAGGSGKRMGGTLPKQFSIVGGKPILAHTINAFRKALPASRIVVVLPDEYIGFWKNLSARFEVAKHSVVEGGKERFHSVKNGKRKTESGKLLFIILFVYCHNCFGKNDIVGGGNFDIERVALA